MKNEGGGVKKIRFDLQMKNAFKAKFKVISPSKLYNFSL